MNYVGEKELALPQFQVIITIKETVQIFVQCYCIEKSVLFSSIMILIQSLPSEV